MKVGLLSPATSAFDAFRRSRERFFPEGPGCYGLTTFDGDVLYIGLATNLKRRLLQHLDNPQKTELTPKGRAVLVHWRPDHNLFLEKLERTWLLIHEQHEGKLPMLNRMHSPVSV